MLKRRIRDARRAVAIGVLVLLGVLFVVGVAGIVVVDDAKVTTIERVLMPAISGVIWVLGGLFKNKPEPVTRSASSWPRRSIESDRVLASIGAQFGDPLSLIEPRERVVNGRRKVHSGHESARHVLAD